MSNPPKCDVETQYEKQGTVKKNNSPTKVNKSPIKKGSNLGGSFYDEIKRSINSNLSAKVKKNYISDQILINDGGPTTSNKFLDQIAEIVTF